MLPSTAAAHRPGTGLVATVTTAKDTPEDLTAFVHRNLQRGADHMFVFLDEADAAAREALSRHPGVTCIECDRSWWGATRPEHLNVRQGINANMTKGVLTRFPQFSWLFHVDSDEVLDIDREQLATIPSDVGVVSLHPLEAISRRRQRGAPSEFKRPLEDDMLQLLHTLGIIDRPANSAYFRGHLAGKPGMRPTLDLNFGIHNVIDLDHQPVEGHEASWLRVLHLHCPNLAAFSRRWENLLTSGPAPKLRQKRASTAAAIAALGRLDLSMSTKRRYARRLYRETTEDRARELKRLGLLEHVDLEERRYEPRQVDPATRAAITATFEGLREVDKTSFRRAQPAGVAAILDAVRVP
ncbi:glycosyltransferase family 2 protein [Nocardioides sp. T2.26MG-1]|uniref:glycosyltransferase family 2 protein n=1 Tax=Nocardioides sp. T2.26MG-1 TaxID=3041166 RepID=UPI002477A238|nr:glycosyltransferase family 2 protein [Nocardioides sp. T2.26MG-1]CAI9401979.1 hypothetical protein HIDPHFAB_00722 [Nocardioides sp. T2.26MG-1]